MKKILLALALITIPILVEAQAMDTLSIKSLVNALGDSIDALIIENTELDKNLREVKSDYANEILKANSTITQLNAFVDAFGIIYTIITILIALLGIVLPVLIWQFGIRPSRRLIKNLENTVEEKIEGYIYPSLSSLGKIRIFWRENQAKSIRVRSITSNSEASEFAPASIPQGYGLDYVASGT
ncbi:hypothetical protein [Lewinella sp. LCG006]|uniref:hypothetical protein n=1 Tax=Lewinella sp. LCG006 TaxID=3231911 RepID=UPI003460BDF1